MPIEFSLENMNYFVDLQSRRALRSKVISW